MPRAKPKGYVIDLFGTLVPPFPQDRYTLHLRRMGERLGVEGEAFSSVWLKDTAKSLTGYFDTVGSEIRATAERLCVRVAETDVRREELAYIHMVSSFLTPRPRTVEALRELKGRGARLALLSNCSPEVPILWPSTPFAPLFDVAVFSSSEGRAKPDPIVFARAAERLGLETAEILYLTDGDADELDAAKEVGMDAWLLDAVDLDPARLGRPWKGHRIDALERIVTPKR